MLFRAVVTLATAALALANPLSARQSNNNQAVNDLLDDLSVASRNAIFSIDQMQANHTATDGTVGIQVQNMISAFNAASSGILALAPGPGSTTVVPRNIDLSRNLGNTIQIVSTGLSGLTAQGSVPTFGAMISQLDPTVAATINALNTTVIGTTGVVHLFMLDAHQFMVTEGSWTETLAALGF